MDQASDTFLSRLTLSELEMRKLGYRIVDMIVDRHVALPTLPVVRRAAPESILPALRVPFPEQGRPFEEALDLLTREVFPNLARVDHPRFFAFVPSPSNFVSVMADALASGFNVFTGTWLSGSGAAAIEVATLDWLRDACGLAPSAEGVLVSGGSHANLTALAVARHARLRGELRHATVYFSDQTHSSVERALLVLGIPSANLRKLESDACFRLPLDSLQARIAADRAASLEPFCVIANAGTTNTGAVDPLPELAAFCRAENLWLHCDGAYGAAAAICPTGRSALPALDLADSLSLDPHKWLFQPFDIGCTFVREGGLLKDTFRIMPEYLEDARRTVEEVHFCDRGIELTRPFRALKLWMSLQVFGTRAFREAVERGFTLANIAEQRLRQSPDWEIVTPAQMAIVTFRHRRDAVTRRLVADAQADGHAFLTSTILRGRPALRLCPINPRTTEDDIETTITRLETLTASETAC
jgi:glutamate/tyrosine decarboxylase-like PLP-dependent enzyme